MDKRLVGATLSALIGSLAAVGIGAIVALRTNSIPAMLAAIFAVLAITLAFSIPLAIRASRALGIPVSRPTGQMYGVAVAVVAYMLGTGTLVFFSFRWTDSRLVECAIALLAAPFAAILAKRAMAARPPPLPQEAPVWTTSALVQGLCAIVFAVNLGLQLLKYARWGEDVQLWQNGLIAAYLVVVPILGFTAYASWQRARIARAAQTRAS